MPSTSPCLPTWCAAIAASQPNTRHAAAVLQCCRSSRRDLWPRRCTSCHSARSSARIKWAGRNVVPSARRLHRKLVARRDVDTTSARLVATSTHPTAAHFNPSHSTTLHRTPPHTTAFYLPPHNRIPTHHTPGLLLRTSASKRGGTATACFDETRRGRATDLCPATGGGGLRWADFTQGV